MNLYPSTLAAVLVIPLPYRLRTTGATAPIERDTAAGAFALGDISVTVVNPAGTPTAFFLDSLPAGYSYAIVGENPQGQLRLTLATSLHTQAGIYTATVTIPSDADYIGGSSSCQWGGWIDTLLGNTEDAKGAAVISQQVLTGAYSVDDTEAPTVQTVSVSGTPFATRTIANADGSPVSGAQVLVLGELTPIS